MKKNKEDKKNKDHHIARVLSLGVYQYFNYLILFAVLLILVLGFLYVLKPKYDTITDNIQTSNDALQDEVDNLNHNLVVLDGYKNSFDGLSEIKKDRLDKFLPSDLDREVLFTQLESLIQGQGYQLNYVRISDLNAVDEAESRERGGSNAKVLHSPPPGIGVYQVEMTISGVNYAGIKNMLSIFESSIRLYDVVEFEVISEADTIMMTIYTYYML